MPVYTYHQTEIATGKRTGKTIRIQATSADEAGDTLIETLKVGGRKMRFSANSRETAWKLARLTRPDAV